MLSLNTLKLFRDLLYQQQIAVGADDEQIAAVLAAKKELADEIARVEAEEEA
jgi:hypothetical protein